MITKLTLTMPIELIRQAKAVAALRGETISGILRARLEEYVREFQAESQAKPQSDDDADWRRLGIEQFFAGYAESDAVYDAL
jgi:hypothetical protein